MYRFRRFRAPQTLVSKSFDDGTSASGDQMSETAAIDRPAHTIGLVSQIWWADRTQLTLIRAELRRWVAPLELTTDAVHDLVLAVNEAVSNAIVHAYPTGTADDTVQITLPTTADSLQMEVADHGRWRTPAPDGCGRGIALMNRLMAAVFIHYDSRGTQVVLHHPLS